MEAILDQIGVLPAIVVVLLVSGAMFVDASPIVGLLLPGDLLFVTVVASSQLPLAALTMAGVVAGTLCSWTLFFFVGARVGPRLRLSRFGRWIGEPRWDSAERLLSGRGARVLTLVQFLPVFNAIMPMVAGVLGMRYRQFVRFAAPGTALWAVCFGTIGITAGLATDRAFGDAGSPLKVLVFGAPGLIAGWLMLNYLRRQLAAQRVAGTAPVVLEPATPAPVETVLVEPVLVEPVLVETMLVEPVPVGSVPVLAQPIPLRPAPVPAAAPLAA